MGDAKRRGSYAERKAHPKDGQTALRLMQERRVVPIPTGPQMMQLLQQIHGLRMKKKPEAAKA